VEASGIDLKDDHDAAERLEVEGVATAVPTDATLVAAFERHLAARRSLARQQPQPSEQTVRVTQPASVAGDSKQLEQGAPGSLAGYSSEPRDALGRLHCCLPRNH
jgi:hypothetical protein